jgi:hypothetical protein
MLRALNALIALLFVPLLVIPLLIVAIAAGPVLVMVLFATGCGGGVFALGGALAGTALALRALVVALIGRIRGGESSTPTIKAAD